MILKTDCVMEQELMPNLIVGRILAGKCKDKTIEIPRIKLFSDDKELPVFKRCQFPKSQDQSFEKVGLYLLNEIFAHGQLYVALSRIINPNNFKIFLPLENEKVSNIVYDEIFEKTTQKAIFKF